MSTLDNRVAEGRLVKFVPRLDTDQTTVRRVYLGPAGEIWCNSRTTPDRRAWAAIMAQLTAFVRGDHMEEPQDFKRLVPEEREIWECRTRPRKKVRMFGWFYRRNTFVISHMKFRDDLDDLVDWDNAIEQTESFRDALDLKPYPHITKDALEGYL